MLPRNLEALVQASLDGTLSPEEQRTLDRLVGENAQVRARVAELRELFALLDLLGPAEATPTLVQDVLAEISQPDRRAHVVSGFSRTAPPRLIRPGFTLNKRIVWGLAAAALVVLAALTFNGYQPIDRGAEATIGAAHGYMAPQVHLEDGAERDTSLQSLLQSDTWDELLRNDSLRSLLQNEALRAQLQRPELQHALADPAVVRALRSRDLASRLADAETLRALQDRDLIRQPADSDLEVALRNNAFLTALQDDRFRALLADANVAATLASPALQKMLLDPGLIRALNHPAFAALK